MKKEECAYRHLGKMRDDILKYLPEKVISVDVIVTEERLAHIRERHEADYPLFLQYGEICIAQPDIVVKDEKNIGTYFMIKKCPGVSLNVVVRMVLSEENPLLKSSVMTFYRIRDKNLGEAFEEKQDILSVKIYFYRIRYIMAVTENAEVEIVLLRTFGSKEMWEGAHPPAFSVWHI